MPRCSAALDAARTLLLTQQDIKLRQVLSLQVVGEAGVQISNNGLGHRYATALYYPQDGQNFLVTFRYRPASF